MPIHTINVYDTEEQALAGLEELKNNGDSQKKEEWKNEEKKAERVVTF